ncbi:MAG: polysaccharide deacetylase family protein, partial [Planctomycetes bacterium]|nr:polysaccharide deacetylase family protein [Planctomycetota bacterium]
MSTCTAALLFSLALVAGEDRTEVGNRLVYLDESCDPYYVGLDTPKLVTPQWVGEERVEAVIVLAIDDLRDVDLLEKFVRPIAKRLKKIDGRASLSMMTNGIDPSHPQVERWFREGITLEAHTDKHPCPCLQGSDLAKAKGVLDRNVDFLVTVPNARPVGYRMPCCDSMNSVSPRFFTEIFGKTTPAGNFLQMDSSVFHLFTSADPELPRELVLEADGRDR